MQYWPGGTAWDSGTNSAWATTGQLLARVSPGTCLTNCGPVPCPKSAPVAEATGLDLYDAFRRYQGRLLQEYEALGEEFGFLKLSARGKAEKTQWELRSKFQELL